MTATSSSVGLLRWSGSAQGRLTRCRLDLSLEMRAPARRRRVRRGSQGARHPGSMLPMSRLFAQLRLGWRSCACCAGSRRAFRQGGSAAAREGFEGVVCPRNRSLGLRGPCRTSGRGRGFRAAPRTLTRVCPISSPAARVLVGRGGGSRTGR